MPLVQAGRLTRIGAALLGAAGASEDATWDRLKALDTEFDLKMKANPTRTRRTT